MTPEPTIPFHAKVPVRTSDPAKRKIDGYLGYIAGVARGADADAGTVYGVFVYDLARVCCCNEAEIEPTGEYDQDSIRRAEQQRQRIAAKWGNTL